MRIEQYPGIFRVHLDRGECSQMTELALDPAVRIRDAERFCQEILPAVSRTFALGIRVLPGSLGRAVLTGYLLCRIADTIEDEPDAAAELKAVRLDRLAAAFDDPAAAQRLPEHLRDVGGEAAHVRLVRHADLVFALFGTLPEASRAALTRWVREMIGGMRQFVLAHPNGIRLRTVDEYREYCYYVAGTVGFLLTDLWEAHAPKLTADDLRYLRERARGFAEALQTVNILKDIAHDAERENAIYIPIELLEAEGSGHATILSAELRERNRAAIEPLMTLAGTGLQEATEYLLRIPRRYVSIRLFCLLPLVYCYATLRKIDRTTAMLAPGGVVKITRGEVKRLLAASVCVAGSNAGVRWLVARAKR
jgi:farnesyl-diphosphate farnesyltransferase